MATVLSVICPGCSRTLNFERPSESRAQMTCPLCQKHFEIDIPAPKRVRHVELDPSLAKPPQAERSYARPPAVVQPRSAAREPVQAPSPTPTSLAPVLVASVIGALTIGVLVLAGGLWVLLRNEPDVVSEANGRNGTEMTQRSEVLPTRAAPQSAEQRRIRQLANVVTQATVAGDYNTVVSHTYQPLVTAMGGAEEMKELAKRKISELAAAGLSLRDGEVGACQPLVETRNYTFAVVPSTLYFDRTDGGSVVGKNHMLAISQDQRDWKFVNCEKNNHFIRRILPELPATLVLPAPVFIDR